MKKIIKENAWAFYLGFCMPFLGISLFSWEYVIVMLPTIILAAWGNHKTEQNENV